MQSHAPIEIAQPPQYTPYANPALASFVKCDGPGRGYQREPFVHDVAAGKGDPLYRVHSYHTKVPPRGIEPFILHYTEPGDVVLDPFCGSGMTGVAALRHGRRAVLNDLSPAASFIAHNYCSPVEPEPFAEALRGLYESVREQMDWMYATRCRKCRRPAVIRHTVWSDVRRCPTCERELCWWDVARGDDGRVTPREVKCPHCGAATVKALTTSVRSVPVAVAYRCSQHGLLEAPVTPADLARIKEVESAAEEMERWVPRCPVPRGDKTRELLNKGLSDTSMVFTRRNLLALAALYDGVAKMEEHARPALFAFTAILLNCSRMFRWRPAGKSGVLTGTIFIPSFHREENVFLAFQRKGRAICKAAPALRHESKSVVTTGSATDLAGLPSDSIDYCFTDPPFGQNLQYSELNFLYESWLGYFTQKDEEAVVNRTQRKKAGDYEELMSQALAEIHRCLKPGRWMTMVFHNSSAEIWGCIQRAVQQSGLDLHSAHTLDKQVGSFNQVSSEGAVGYDVVLNCLKTRKRARQALRGLTDDEMIVEFIADRLRDQVRGGAPCTKRKLYSDALAHFLKQRRQMHTDYKQFLALLSEHFHGAGDG